MLERFKFRFLNKKDITVRPPLHRDSIANTSFLDKEQKETSSSFLNA